MRRNTFMASGRRLWRPPILVLIAAGAAFTLWSGRVADTQRDRVPRPSGSPQLISYESLPELEGEMCQWAPASYSLAAALRAQQLPAANPGTGARAATERSAVAQRNPLRVIQDPNAGYSAVAVDPVRNEVVLTDENRFNILVYDRLANTPPTASMTEPKRIIGGLKSKIQYECGVYVDPGSGDIYVINNDTVRNLVVFSREAKGNVEPDRELSTPYGSFGIAVDEQEQELFLTVQHDGAVMVFPKMASGEDAPIRLLQGDRTGLADPHGIALDAKNDLIYVANYGAARRVRLPGLVSPKPNWPVGNLGYREDVIHGSGSFNPPSIRVFPKKAAGNTAPLRVIEGPKAQLNWPTGIAVDPEHNELFVANATGQTITVYRATASGDVAPVRVLQGPKTMLKDPTGIYLDTKNDELWVANFGNHAATVYKRTASGDTPPLRVIRSAPLNAPASLISNPYSLAYDGKREQILVPN